MTEEQKTHAAKLGDEAERRLIYKYAKGAKEHGGNIWELSPLVLLEEAINEAIDQVVYLMTLKENLQGYHPRDDK